MSSRRHTSPPRPDAASCLARSLSAQRSLPLLLTLLTLGSASALSAQSTRKPLSQLDHASAAKFAPRLFKSLTRSSPSATAAKPVPVIVQTDGKTAAIPTFAASGSTLRRFSAAANLRSEGKGTSSALLDHFGTCKATLTEAQLASLAKNPHVRHISPDHVLFAAQTYATQAVGADTAWASPGATGSGVGVAVLDSGVFLHDDLTKPTSRVTGWVDLVNGQPTPYDDNGHGTHVSGIIAGGGTVSLAQGYTSLIKGIAPSAHIIGVKVLDGTGNGNVSTVLAGIDWCIAHKADYNIRVLNLSLGHSIDESYATDPLCQALERAWNAGLVVVCSAGNNGRSVPSDASSPPAYGSVTSPGNDPRVITVGAMSTRNTLDTADDGVTSYSSRGPSVIDYVLKPDLVAPGNAIDSLAAPGSHLLTTYPGNSVTAVSYGGTGADSYYRLSGTSMAAPAVCGAAALLIGMDATLTPDAVKARLMASATKPPVGDYFSFGAGYLNIPAALASTLTAPAGAYSPRMTQINADGSLSIDTSLWPNGNIWGENWIWGVNTPKTENWIWGNNWIWGFGAQNWIWGSNSQPGSQNWIWGFTSQNWIWGVGTQPSAQNWIWGFTSQNWIWGNNWIWGFNTQTGAQNWIWGDGDETPAPAINNQNWIWGFTTPTTPTSATSLLLGGD